MVTKTKATLIAIGVVLVIITMLSIALYISYKNNTVKQSKIELLESKIVENKAVCNTEKLKLISDIRQLELDFVAKSAAYNEVNKQTNTVIRETVRVEKEDNIVIVEKARDENTFDPIWVRLNDLLKL